jgi:hypothetical protein
MKNWPKSKIGDRQGIRRFASWRIIITDIQSGNIGGLASRNQSLPKFAVFEHPFCHRGMQPPKQKKTRRGKRKTPRCRTGRRHTRNAPDPTLDRGGGGSVVYI